MEFDVKRKERQIEGIKRWLEAPNFGGFFVGHGTLYWPTGVGKTIGGVFAASHIIKKYKGDCSIIILTPSPIIKEQWINQINEFFPEKYHNLFEFYTVKELYNSLFDIDCTLLIVDELHEFYSKENYNIICKSKFKYCLGLTANYFDSQKREQQPFIQNFFPVIDTIKLEEAIELGFISKFLEYNLKVILSEKDKSNYEFYSDEIAKYGSKLGRNALDMANKVLKGGLDSTGRHFQGIGFAMAIAIKHGWNKDLDFTLQENQEINELWNPNKIIGYAKKYMENIKVRKEFIYNYPKKIEVALEILKKFDNSKTIIFSESTAIVDKLHEEIQKYRKNKSVIYHSNIKSVKRFDPKKNKEVVVGSQKLKKEAITAFTNNLLKTNVILTANSLNKGFNVKDIKIAITLSGTQNYIQHNQRRGRAVRLESIYANDIILIINLYCEGTKEKEWLKNRQKETDTPIYWIDNIEDIVFDPKPITKHLTL